MATLESHNLSLRVRFSGRPKRFNFLPILRDQARFSTPTRFAVPSRHTSEVTTSTHTSVKTGISDGTVQTRSITSTSAQGEHRDMRDTCRGSLAHRCGMDRRLRRHFVRASPLPSCLLYHGSSIRRITGSIIQAS